MILSTLLASVCLAGTLNALAIPAHQLSKRGQYQPALMPIVPGMAQPGFAPYNSPIQGMSPVLNQPFIAPGFVPLPNPISKAPMIAPGFQQPIIPITKQPMIAPGFQRPIVPISKQPMIASGFQQPIIPISKQPMIAPGFQQPIIPFGKQPMIAAGFPQPIIPISKQPMIAPGFQQPIVPISKQPMIAPAYPSISPVGKGLIQQNGGYPIVQPGFAPLPLPISTAGKNIMPLGKGPTIAPSSAFHPYEDDEECDDDVYAPLPYASNVITPKSVAVSKAIAPVSVPVKPIASTYGSAPAFATGNPVSALAATAVNSGSMVSRISTMLAFCAAIVLLV